MSIDNHLRTIDVAALIAAIEEARKVRAEADDIKENSVKPKLKDFQAEMKEVWDTFMVENKTARKHLGNILDMEPDELARYAREMVPIFAFIQEHMMTDALRDLVDIMQDDDE